MGVLDLEQREWLKAQSVLEKATQIEPTNARALSALGMALGNQKKYAEAIVSLERSVELDPASVWETHWSLAQLLVAVGRYEESAQVLREVLKKHTDGPEAATARRFLAKLAADGKIKGQ